MPGSSSAPSSRSFSASPAAVPLWERAVRQNSLASSAAAPSVPPPGARWKRYTPPPMGSGGRTGSAGGTERHSSRMERRAISPSGARCSGPNSLW